ncbi:hypothetical protein HPB50_027892 [Hyalomma asiaticum]|nr:hypothetical protein HPB50_027892 [Hyalomma asiaticum]
MRRARVGFFRIIAALSRDSSGGRVWERSLSYRCVRAPKFPDIIIINFSKSIALVQSTPLGPYFTAADRSHLWESLKALLNVEGPKQKTVQLWQAFWRKERFNAGKLLVVVREQQRGIGAAGFRAITALSWKSLAARGRMVRELWCTRGRKRTLTTTPSHEDPDRGDPPHRVAHRDPAGPA